MQRYNTHCKHSRACVCLCVCVCELSPTLTHTPTWPTAHACTLETLQMDNGAALLPLLDPAELTGLQAGPSVSQQRPPPRPLFVGTAALSSWLSRSSVCAHLEPLAVSSCQEFIILNTAPMFSTINKRKGDNLWRNTTSDVYEKDM